MVEDRRNRLIFKALVQENEVRHMADKMNAKRLAAGVLILALFVSLLPVGLLGATAAASDYGKIVMKDVKLRDEANTSCGYNFQMPLYWIVEIVSSSGSGSNLWYKVKAKNPEPNTGYIKEGYVLGSCLEVLTEDGYTSWVNSGKPDQGDFASTKQAAAATATATETSGAAEEGTNPTATPTPASSATGYVKLILSSANLRDGADGKKVNEWLPKHGSVMPYSGAPTSKGSYKWYYIKFTDGKNYYVRSDTVSTCDVSGNLISDATVTSAATTAGSTAVAGIGTIQLIKSDVNLRKTEGGDVIGRLNKGTELSYTAVSSKGGYTWYYITTSAGLKGYVRGDCCQVLSGSATTTSPTGSSTTGTYGSFKLTLDDVLLRVKPAGTYIERLKKGTVLPVTAEPVKSGSYTWYPVTAASGISGYVRGDTGSYTGTSSGTDTPTSAPTSSTGNYVMITNNAVNLRKDADGASIGRVNKNEIYPMTGSVVKKGSYDWYPIKTSSLSGFVRGDMCQQLTAEQVQEYLNNQPISSATPAPTGSAASSYLITTVDKVYLRTSASKESESKGQVNTGTVMAYSSSTTSSGTLWYKVVYNNQSVWIMGEYVKIMTAAEYEAWKAANPAATTPATEVVTGYVKTKESGLNVRKEPGGTVMGRIDKGLILAYQGAPISKSGNLWYYCKTSLGYGYIVDTYLENCDASGAVTAAPTSTSTSGSGKKEASYSTLKVGSSGTAVKELVTELKAQGYFSGSITSSYTTGVQNAVIAFQKAKGLSVDGVAGPATQHALFGTVPIGTNTDPSFTMYTCEKIDWYTGGIQTIWAKGKVAVIKDVKTGYVMNVYRWSGGNHADVEPLTAGDTARMCKMYGVSNADQIVSKNLWQRRPIWVTIGGRTFAASMFGFPHNYPAGDTIATNDFKGQFCIHFVNSKTHDSNRVDSFHQAAIEEAYKAAPSRK